MYSILDIFTSLLSLSNSIFLNERYKIEFQINQTVDGFSNYVQQMKLKLVY